MLYVAHFLRKIWTLQKSVLHLHPISKGIYMVDVAQSVRVTDCGSEGRGFESHLPPQVNKPCNVSCEVFLFLGVMGNSVSI